ncbi:MAG: lipoyl synthase [Kiritimatiellae bacterium]|nr:lipoyl synthase [Kiritimatiellia bacterium]
MNRPHPKPPWLRKPLVPGETQVRRVVADASLHTVCEEARCPNRRECWCEDRSATFLILGNRCTRRCDFCAVGREAPELPDPGEPERIATAVRAMSLRFAVVTMVTRDDLPDGGAAAMAATVRAIRAEVPDCKVEVLPSDFGGLRRSLEMLAGARPEVFGHNIETVRRLTPEVRRGASYERSLTVLRTYRELDRTAVLKSALLVGFGESRDEVLETLDDLRAAGVEVVAIGQYLQPARDRRPVARYWTPEEFDALREEARRRGFAHCEAGPWVRSSYRAELMYRAALAGRGQ